jgi:uncharacterized protein (TIGR02453 family)
MPRRDYLIAPFFAVGEKHRRPNVDRLPSFQGFPAEGLKFLKDLAAHNRRPWFEAHKGIYQESLLRPAQAFVNALGESLHRAWPVIGYDDRTNGQGSLHRIYRDIRFSKDKTPYKTHLGIFFWYGSGKKDMNHPGFFFHLDAAGARVYSGMWEFSPEMLSAYRRAVDDKKTGAALAGLIAALKKKKGYEVGGEFYKRVPSGFDPESPRAGLLRFNALYAMGPKLNPAALKSASLVKACLDHCRALSGLNSWLQAVAKSAAL